jgi:peptidoglycan/LPS O-acetylase OafA/YrhL
MGWRINIVRFSKKLFLAASQGNQEMRKFHSIQQLRAIAALMVVLYHVYAYSIRFNAEYNGFFEKTEKFGLIGVLLFFVISGFIMSYLIDIQEPLFLLKRILRIYPSYFLAVMLLIFLKAFLFSSVSLPYLPKAMSLLPFSVMQQEDAVYPLAIEWTLVYEIFFYIICYLMSLSIFRIVRYKIMLIWLFAIVIINYFFRSVAPMRPGWGEIGVSVYNIPFILGFFSYYLYKNSPFATTDMKLKKLAKLNLIDKNHFRILFWLVVLVIVMFEEVILSSHMKTMFQFGIVALVNLSGILFLLSIELDSPDKFISRIGDNSYGIYLVHASVIDIFLYFLAMKVDINNCYMSLTFIVAVIVGYLYGNLDNVIQRYLKERIQSVLGNKKIPANS